MTNFSLYCEMFTGKITQLLAHQSLYACLILLVDLITYLIFSALLLLLFALEKVVEFKELVSDLFLPFHLLLLVEIVMSLVIILDLHFTVLFQALS